MRVCFKPDVLDIYYKGIITLHLRHGKWRQVLINDSSSNGFVSTPDRFVYASVIYNILQSSAEYYSRDIMRCRIKCQHHVNGNDCYGQYASLSYKKNDFVKLKHNAFVDFSFMFFLNDCLYCNVIIINVYWENGKTISKLIWLY